MMEMIFQSFSPIFYSVRIKLHVSIKNEKPYFFPSYPDHFHLGNVSVDHIPTIYILRCIGIMVYLMILK